MRYVELPPPPPLAPFVQTLWALEGEAAEARVERVLPDGRAELVLHGGETFCRRHADGGAEPQARALFAGQLTRAIELVPRGSFAVVGARFRPHGAGAFVRDGALGLTDRILPLAELLGERVAGHAAEHVGLALDLDARLAVLVELLSKRLAGSRPDDRCAAACERLAASGGRAPVAEVARELGCSTRSLERRFREEVGLRPKELARIERFQRAVGLLGRVPLSRVAAAAGYADQAHLTREFRRLAGEPPGAFAAGEHELSDRLTGGSTTTGGRRAPS